MRLRTHEGFDLERIWGFRFMGISFQTVSPQLRWVVASLESAKLQQVHKHCAHNLLVVKIGFPKWFGTTALFTCTRQEFGSYSHLRPGIELEIDKMDVIDKTDGVFKAREGLSLQLLLSGPDSALDKQVLVLGEPSCLSDSTPSTQEG